MSGVAGELVSNGLTTALQPQILNIPQYSHSAVQQRPSIEQVAH